MYTMNESKTHINSLSGVLGQNSLSSVEDFYGETLLEVSGLIYGNITKIHTKLRYM